MINLEIIVYGPFASGKTTLIRSLSEKEVVTVKIPKHLQATSAPMDYGLIEVDNGSAIVLLGTSGSRFSFDWCTSEEFLLGYIITVDSAQPITFREAKRIIEIFMTDSPKPFVIAANKQDQPNAWSLDDFRLALDIPPEIPVLPCIATDKESVKRVLVTLLDEVLKVMAADNDSEEQYFNQ